MDITKLFRDILAIGRHGEFCCLSSLDSLQEHRALQEFIYAGRRQLRWFVVELDRSDQLAFMKALVMLEEQRGILGSTSIFRDSMALLWTDRELMDWIFNHTEYFASSAFGVRSWAELEAREARRQAHRREYERQQDLAREKRAARATENLFNAVRRRDLKAVIALLGRGANGDSLCPDGRRLQAYADANGLEEIAQLLHGGSATRMHEIPFVSSLFVSS